tara:strand:+ start:746 stop:1279 length:534 start_codon:yes stop_codon:yes gene_type:complete
MKKIVYYVACSLDGYVAGPKGDSSMFVKKGSVATRYKEEISDFDSVMMCRQTYEFGYGYGLQAGQPACAGKVHYIFSNSLVFKSPHPDVHVVAPAVENINALKQESGSNIYFCGGGPFAGWLLENGLIDTLKLRVNPVIIGSGTTLFGSSAATARMELLESVTCDGGVQINEYRILK